MDTPSRLDNDKEHIPLLKPSATKAHFLSNLKTPNSSLIRKLEFNSLIDKSPIPKIVTEAMQNLKNRSLPKIAFPKRTFVNNETTQEKTEEKAEPLKIQLEKSPEIIQKEKDESVRKVYNWEAVLNKVFS